MDTILLVDAYPIVTCGLSKILHDAGIDNAVVQVHTVQHATQAISGRLGLLVVDPAMPDTTPDMFVVMARRKQPDLPIVFFSSQSHGIHLSLAQSLGVNGYLNKGSDLPTIVSTLRMVMAGMQCFPRPDNYSAQTTAAMARLTSRELVVLQMLRQGLRNKDIAERMFLSPKTVSSHKRNLLRKLGVDDVVPDALYQTGEKRKPETTDIFTTS